MTRTEAIAILPSYVAGDLDDDTIAVVAALLAKDDELRVLAEQLQLVCNPASQVVVSLPIPDLESEPPVVVIDTLAQTTQTNGPTPEWGSAPVSSHTSESSTAATHSSRPLGRAVWIPLAAAAVAVIVGASVLRSLGSSSGPVESNVAAYISYVEVTPGIDVSDGTALASALSAAGVPDNVAPAADLSAIGLVLQQAIVLPGSPPGVAFVYSDGDTEYICQVWSDVSLPVRSTVRRTLGGVPVRAFQEGSRSIATWIDNGRICVMSAEVDMDTLLGVVEQRLAVTR